MAHHFKPLKGNKQLRSQKHSLKQTSRRKGVRTLPAFTPLAPSAGSAFACSSLSVSTAPHSSASFCSASIRANSAHASARFCACACACVRIRVCVWVWVGVRVRTDYVTEFECLSLRTAFVDTVHMTVHPSTHPLTHTYPPTSLLKRLLLGCLRLLCLLLVLLTDATEWRRRKESAATDRPNAAPDRGSTGGLGGLGGGRGRRRLLEHHPGLSLMVAET